MAVIMKNVFNISLTRGDYRYYKANEREFATSNYARFIDANAPGLGQITCYLCPVSRAVVQEPRNN